MSGADTVLPIFSVARRGNCHWGQQSLNFCDPAAIYLFHHGKHARRREVPRVINSNGTQMDAYLITQKFKIQDNDVFYFGNAPANQPSKLVGLFSQLFSPVLTVTSAVSVFQSSNNCSHSRPHFQGKIWKFRFMTLRASRS